MNALINIRRKIKEEVKSKTVLMTNLRDIINRILKIMKKHIGEDNRISRNTLFREVYGISPDKVSELQEWFLWELIKKAMHKCRQRTKCFIISKAYPMSRFSKGGIYHYWVANDGTDFIIFRDNINRNIKAMNEMVKKCDRAVRNEWHKAEWDYK